MADKNEIKIKKIKNKTEPEIPAVPGTDTQGTDTQNTQNADKPENTENADQQISDLIKEIVGADVSEGEDPEATAAGGDVGIMAGGATGGVEFIQSGHESTVHADPDSFTIPTESIRDVQNIAVGAVGAPVNGNIVEPEINVGSVENPGTENAGNSENVENVEKPEVEKPDTDVKPVEKPNVENPGNVEKPEIEKPEVSKPEVDNKPDTTEPEVEKPNGIPMVDLDESKVIHHTPMVDLEPAKISIPMTDLDPSKVIHREPMVDLQPAKVSVPMVDLDESKVIHREPMVDLEPAKTSIPMVDLQPAIDTHKPEISIKITGISSNVEDGSHVHVLVKTEPGIKFVLTSENGSNIAAMLSDGAKTFYHSENGEVELIIPKKYFVDADGDKGHNIFAQAVTGSGVESDIASAKFIDSFEMTPSKVSVPMVDLDPNAVIHHTPMVDLDPSKVIHHEPMVDLEPAKTTLKPFEVWAFEDADAIRSENPQSSIVNSIQNFETTDKTPVFKVVGAEPNERVVFDILINGRPVGRDAATTNENGEAFLKIGYKMNSPEALQYQGHYIPEIEVGKHIEVKAHYATTNYEATSGNILIVDDKPTEPQYDFSHDHLVIDEVINGGFGNFNTKVIGHIENPSGFDYTGTPISYVGVNVNDTDSRNGEPSKVFDGNKFEGFIGFDDLINNHYNIEAKVSEGRHYGMHDVYENYGFNMELPKEPDVIIPDVPEVVESTGPQSVELPKPDFDNPDYSGHQNTIGIDWIKSYTPDNPDQYYVEFGDENGIQATEKNFTVSGEGAKPFDTIQLFVTLKDGSNYKIAEMQANKDGQFDFQHIQPKYELNGYEGNVKFTVVGSSGYEAHNNVNFKDAHPENYERSLSIKDVLNDDHISGIDSHSDLNYYDGSLHSAHQNNLEQLQHELNQHIM